jgi:hypothetical protein
VANSAFKPNQSVPFPVTEGGTGLSSLTDKAVLIGKGTASLGSVSPGNLGNVLKSDGTDWQSQTPPPPADETVNYEKLASEFTQIVLLDTNDVDWSQGGIFVKTITANTNLTFSNCQLNKSVVLKVDGNYSLSLPDSVKVIKGEYDGKETNYIFLHCVEV